ncbi:MAG TPA: FHA domain-containing protein [Gammaproteobacteria bacterium]|nr:FHA domain-containing protein [Gammaproteobacteria bacterium]
MSEAPEKPAHEDLVDDSPTDELPVLTELDVVDDPGATLRVGALVEDTGLHGTVRIAVGAAAADDTSRLALELHEQRRMLADKEATIASLEERLAAALDAIARRDRNEAAARAELERRKRLIESLEADGALAQGRTEELERTSAELRAKLEAADREIAEKRRSEQELLDWLESEEKAREGLKAELEESRRRIEELESRGADSETYRRELDAAKAAAETAAAERAAVEARAAALAADVEAANARAAALTADRDAANAQAASLAAERDGAMARASSVSADLEAANARTASLAADLEAANRRSESLARELAALEAGNAELRGELQAARESAATHETAARAGAGDRDALTHAREEAAALAAYIENRRAHWQEMQAGLAEKDAEIEALRREVAQRSQRQHEAEQKARSERERARQLHRELADLRLTEDRRTADAARSPGLGASAEHTGTAEHERAHLEAALERERLEFKREREGLLSELERERLEIQALRGAAAAKDVDLVRLTEQHAALERMLDESKKQLAEALASAARFERLLLENGTGAGDSRIADGRRGADGADTASRREPLAIVASHSSRSLKAAFERRTTPVLVCLTGETPRSYRLGKEALTIGRGGHCEIQIATQFVSREHARLQVGPDRVEITDLGSKNGVFVNSVRVAHETLRHGDLVTVGETQFRFLAE